MIFGLGKLVGAPVSSEWIKCRRRLARPEDLESEHVYLNFSNAMSMIQVELKNGAKFTRVVFAPQGEKFFTQDINEQPEIVLEELARIKDVSRN
jgi:hypothetical protein